MEDKNDLIKMIDDFEKELEGWFKFLNTEMGLISFLMALSCLGTPFPSICALLAMFFVGAIYKYNKNKFPKLLRELRAKDNKSKNEKDILETIEIKYFGIKNLIKEAPYFFGGFLFLGFIAAGGFKLLYKLSIFLKWGYSK